MRFFPKDDHRGGVFLATLGGLAFLWAILAIAVIQKPEEVREFLKIYFFTNLDIAVLIIIMWKLFFSQRTKTIWKVDLVFWFVFKLVCWIFLAITLKRLTNANGKVLLFGVGFAGVGPIIAGLLTQLLEVRLNSQRTDQPNRD